MANRPQPYQNHPTCSITVITRAFVKASANVGTFGPPISICTDSNNLSSIERFDGWCEAGIRLHTLVNISANLSS